MIVIRAVQFDAADGDTVTVEGNQSQVSVLDFHEFTGHHLVAVVVGDRENRLCDDVAQCKLGNIDSVDAVDIRETREFAAVSAGNVKIDFAALYFHGFIFRTDVYIAVRKLADDRREDVRINCNKSLLINSSGDNGFNAEFHIISEKTDSLCTCFEQYTFKNRHGCLIGNGFTYNIDSIGEICFADCNFHLLLLNKDPEAFLFVIVCYSRFLSIRLLHCIFCFHTRSYGWKQIRICLTVSLKRR